MQYDVTIITVRPGTHGKALPGVEAWLKANPAKGEFLACLYSDIGALNQIMLLHGYADPAALAADRETAARSDNPFGCLDFTTGISRDTYVPFPTATPIKPGQYGPIFEVRTYLLRPASLTPTIEAWKVAVPERVKLSPMITAMYTLSGPVPRFVHIWPYPSLDERAKIRAKAIETGVWPPKGGPDHLQTQQTDIFLPAAFSPMR
jgi:hypothetical protein